MHQHPPQTPLWRSTSTAKSGHVAGDSALTTKPGIAEMRTTGSFFTGSMSFNPLRRLNIVT
jgi:hypothetical protein